MDAQMGDPDFWNSNDRAQKHIAKLNGLKKAVFPVVAYQKKLDDMAMMRLLARDTDALALVPSVVWLEVVCMFLALQALMPPPRLSKLVQMLF